MKVQYEEIGEPEDTGVYACRVDDPRGTGRVVDVFLWWAQGQWFWHVDNARAVEGDVHGWIGPLPRIRPLRTNVEAPE